MGDSIGLKTTELTTAFQRALPEDLAGLSEQLARFLVQALTRQGVIADDGDSGLIKTLLASLAGRSLTFSQSVISFGKDNNLGDISVGDVAGGNIVKITVNLGADKVSVTSPIYQSDDDARHRLKLIEIHRKRLRVLEEQQALFGISCPPHITIEIEDINAKMLRLL